MRLDAPDNAPGVKVLSLATKLAEEVDALFLCRNGFNNTLRS